MLSPRQRPRIVRNDGPNRTPELQDAPPSMCECRSEDERVCELPAAGPPLGIDGEVGAKEVQDDQAPEVPPESDAEDAKHSSASAQSDHHDSERAEAEQEEAASEASGVDEQAVHAFFQRSLAKECGYKGVEVTLLPAGVEIVIKCCSPKKALGPKGGKIRELAEQLKQSIAFPSDDVTIFTEHVVWSPTRG